MIHRRQNIIGCSLTCSCYDTTSRSAGKRSRRPFPCKPRVTSTPFARALLYLSLLSFATCFPSCDVIKLRSRPEAKTKSRSPFSRVGGQTLSRHNTNFPQKVVVLSFSSTSLPPKPDVSRHAEKSHKKSRIAIEKIDGVEPELPLRTREYRRRKHEWAKRYTSQEGLREAFGRNKNRLWGDLDARTARRLYKSLLFPTAISELVLELGDECARPEELAPLAYEARKAAKMYVRERCRVPSRVVAYLLDGFRQLRRYGKFQPNGASYEQLWSRYYEENGNKTDEEFDLLFGPNVDDQYDESEINTEDDTDIIDDVDDAVTEDEIVKRTCQKILEKSCTTNEAIDRFYLKKYDVSTRSKGDGDIDSLGEDADIVDDIDKGKRGRGKRWRERKKRKDRYNDLLLKRITKTLERDVRKLLEPEPPTLSSSHMAGDQGTLYQDYGDACEKEDFARIGEIKARSNDGDWSSRRMTQQEYHSLKLFAKARKTSQRQGKETNSSDLSKKHSSSDGIDDSFTTSTETSN